VFHVDKAALRPDSLFASLHSCDVAILVPAGQLLPGLSFTYGLVGDAVGDSVGDFVVGDAVGDCVVGDAVGDCVVGEPVGDSVGDCVVGDPVGDCVVGEPVGDSVGDCVVGDPVGECVKEYWRQTGSRSHRDPVELEFSLN
jgi:hypothetical protein